MPVLTLSSAEPDGSLSGQTSNPRTLTGNEVLPSVTLCRSLGREKHSGEGTPISKTAGAVGNFVPFGGH